MFLCYFPLILLFFNRLNTAAATDLSLKVKQSLMHFFPKAAAELPPSECMAEINTFVNALKRSEPWAVKMLDSFAKPQAGILYGNTMHMGNYDECLEINSGKLRGQYCSLLYGPHPQYGGNLTKTFLELLGLVSKDIGSEDIITRGRFSMGFCVPSVCTVVDLQILGDFLEKQLESPLHFTFLEGFCDDGGPRPITTAAILSMLVYLDDFDDRQCPASFLLSHSYFSLVFAFFGVLVVISTVYDVFYCRQINQNPNLLLAFSLKTNGKKLFSTSSSEGNLRCLNGFRVISMMWVVYGHNVQYAVYLPHINSAKLFTTWKNATITSFYVSNGLAVDTFFTISGLLVVYLFMKNRDKRVNFSLPMFYFHRILRLTPSLIMVVLFTTTLLGYMGRGPFWGIVDVIFQTSCREHWWSTIIYLQNYLNPADQCVGHSWYLAVDTQMYFIAPLILFPLVKWPKRTIGVIIVVIISSCIYVFVNTWQYHRGAVFFNQNEDYFIHLYVPTHVRGAIYLMGMICGYLVYKSRTTCPLKLSKRKVIFLWILSLSMLLGTILAHIPMYKYEYDILTASLFNSLRRVVWSLGIFIIILLCVNGYGCLIDTFLSCSVFSVLIKLNYNVYLLHILIMISIVGQMRTPTYLSLLDIAHSFWGYYMFSVGVSIFWTLAFESPVVYLEQIIFNKNRPILKKPKDDLRNGNAIEGSVSVDVCDNGRIPNASNKNVV